MDNSQLMKGILEGVVLAVIARGETYGYEILSVMEESGFSGLGEGTLYPVLTRLDKAGLIVCRKAKSPLGPVRKYYSITPDGKSQLADFRTRYRELTRSAAAILFPSGSPDHMQ